jgi:hypothetical protein
MNLLLVEYGSQVEDFLGRFGSDFGHWIALGPSAMWALDQKGIRYEIPESFYQPEELEGIP